MDTRKEQINIFFMYFLICQPLIDLVTSLNVRFINIPISLGMVIRSLFLLIIIIYYLFFIQSVNKKKVSMYIGIVILYLIIYLINNVHLKGIIVLYDEVKYIAKLFYFPILLVILVDFIKIKKIDINIKTLINIVYIYIFIIFIAQLTGTQFMSYSSGKLGHVGWFYAPNEIGAIIAIITPIVVYNLILNRTNIISYFAFLIYIYATFIIGTKVPFFGLLFSIIGFISVFILKILFKEGSVKEQIKNIIMPLCVCLSIIILIFPNTFIRHNLNLHLKWLGAETVGELKDISKRKELDNFIYSNRDVYHQKYRLEYRNAKIKEKFLGIGITPVNNVSSIKLIEIDYYDILYKNGIIGFGLYFYFFILFLGESLIKITKKFKIFLKNLNFMVCAMGIVLGLGIAYFAGHVFLAPAVSIYMVVLLARLIQIIEEV